MDIRTSCQIFLGVLLAAIAVSVLGLAADNVNYVSKQNGSPVAIHYNRWNETAQGQYSYWVTMDYTPSRFSMGPMYAMIITSLVCFLVGAGVAVSSWIMRGTKTLPTTVSLKERSLPFLPATLILTTIAFLTSFAVAIYVWHPVMRWPIKFYQSLPLPPSYSGANGKSAVVYESSMTFTPEVWNCLLAPYVVQPAQSQRLQGLCQEAGVARYLMLPVLLLSAALLVTLLWTWRSAKRAAASDAENAPAKEVEEVSVHSKE